MGSGNSDPLSNAWSPPVYRVYGSHGYERDLNALETKHSNIAARRMLGAGSSAHIGILYAISGTHSVHNLYIQHCAKMLDKSLRATSSTISARLMWWCAREYEMETWGSTTSVKPTSKVPLVRTGTQGIWEYDVKEEWVQDGLPNEPRLQARFVNIPSVFVSNADEIEKKWYSKRKHITLNKLGHGVR